jgi:tetrahydromethanopterin S-methyltransferase subunit C
MTKNTSKFTVRFSALLILIALCGLVAASLYKELLPAVGGTFLGTIIGMLVGFYAQEVDKWTREAMTASAVVLTGAGALALLRYNAADPQGVWYYPIGLLLGFGFGAIWAEIDR